MKYQFINSDEITAADLEAILGIEVLSISRGGIIVGEEIRFGVEVEINGTLNTDQEYILDSIFAKQKYNPDKIADILDNIPSWSQVQTAINNISNLAEAKAFLLKLTKVVYWLAKNRAD